MTQRHIAVGVFAVANVAKCRPIVSIDFIQINQAQRQTNLLIKTQLGYLDGKKNKNFNNEEKTITRAFQVGSARLRLNGEPVRMAIPINTPRN